MSSSASSVYYYEPFLDVTQIFDDGSSARMGSGTSSSHSGQPLDPVNSQRLVYTPEFSAFKPRMDLHEDQESNLVTVTMELPGLRKEDIEVEVNNGRLTIKADKRLPEGFEESGYAVRERKFGKFLRTIHLPLGVEALDVKVSLEHGVLSLAFPKTKAGQVHGPQQVPIS